MPLFAEAKIIVLLLAGEKTFGGLFFVGGKKENYGLEAVRFWIQCFFFDNLL